ncbi:hypothetical protein OpiT1DRAFT_04666 [Opitutaceae bacterium TAV1]|nr:hypothetical protein OPIT5_18210 [Opitutaceae bacterium TAV5]EIQ00127.1 hypothetical protein OpiT1DRAFT_04666 [Opitutaceae bacterium TAV1]
MKPILPSLLTGAARSVMCLAFVISAQAAVSIQDSDVSVPDHTYRFNLSADQLTGFDPGGSLVSASGTTPIRFICSSSLKKNHFVFPPTPSPSLRG